MTDRLDALLDDLDQQVARKLVLMEQDLERSEEKVEMNERFVQLRMLLVLTILN